MLAKFFHQISIASLQSEIRFFFFFYLTKFKLLSVDFQKMYLSAFIGFVRAVELFFFVMLSVLWFIVISLPLNFDMGPCRSFCCAELTTDGY